MHRVFAHLHIPKELNPRKFDTRSKKCIMVGYTDNGYRVWSQEDERIICRRDVIFDETKFKHNQPFVETDCREENENECKEESDKEKFIVTTEDNNDQRLLGDELVSEEEKKNCNKI